MVICIRWPLPDAQLHPYLVQCCPYWAQHNLRLTQCNGYLILVHGNTYHMKRWFCLIQDILAQHLPNVISPGTAWHIHLYLMQDCPPKSNLAIPWYNMTLALLYRVSQTRYSSPYLILGNLALVLRWMHYSQWSMVQPLSEIRLSLMPVL